MFVTRIKIMWEEQLVDPPIHYLFWDILFCPIGPKKNLGPIPWQAVEIIGGLLASE